MKLCPECGNIVPYNSYFGAYICGNCNWEKSSRTKQGYVVTRGISRSEPHSKKYAVSRKTKLISIETYK